MCAQHLSLGAKGLAYKCYHMAAFKSVSPRTSLKYIGEKRDSFLLGRTCVKEQSHSCPCGIRERPRLGVVVHSYSPRTQGTEIGGLTLVWGQPGLQNAFQASLVCRIRPCTKQRGREESMSVLGREIARSRPGPECWSYPASIVALAGVWARFFWLWSEGSFSLLDWSPTSETGNRCGIVEVGIPSSSLVCLVLLFWHIFQTPDNC